MPLAADCTTVWLALPVPDWARSIEKPLANGKAIELAPRVAFSELIERGMILPGAKLVDAKKRHGALVTVARFDWVLDIRRAELLCRLW